MDDDKTRLVWTSVWKFDELLKGWVDEWMLTDVNQSIETRRSCATHGQKLALASARDRRTSLSSLAVVVVAFAFVVMLIGTYSFRWHFHHHHDPSFSGQHYNYNHHIRNSRLRQRRRPSFSHACLLSSSPPPKPWSVCGGGFFCNDSGGALS